MKVQLLPKKVWRVTLQPAGCAVDLGDGSERGGYVGQDYLLSRMRRPHRSIGLMYCYYPGNKKWPLRASVAYQPHGILCWDYPYDDYFPYLGGPGGTTRKEPFTQIRDIRSHGQEVTLTLTMDCAVTDHQLMTIARELKPFGRLRLRINHECDGDWFRFNKDYSYAEVGRFFVRASRVIKSIAPEIRTICCWGSWDPVTGRLRYEDKLAPMLQEADIWSFDRYLNLHFGFPNNICEPGQLGKKYAYTGVKKFWDEMHRVYERFCVRSGQRKPLELSEINADGDVGGYPHQVRLMKEFYDQVLKEQPSFLKGISYYQFRDRGRLGLEEHDRNDPEVGIPTPFFKNYVSYIQHPYFLPLEKWSSLRGPLSMMWRDAEDSDGVGWKVPLQGKPLFFELKFDKDIHLMVQVGTEWFAKKPGVEWVDATSVCQKAGRGTVMPVVVFAPPADGANPGSGTYTRTSCPARLTQAPLLRVRYEWK